jgi:hypothetical protein
MRIIFNKFVCNNYLSNNIFPSKFSRYRGGVDSGVAFGDPSGQSGGHGSYNSGADIRGFEYLVNDLTLDYSQKGYSGEDLEKRVQTEAKSIYKKRIESNKQYWTAEVDEKMEMETEYTIRVNDQGEKELYHEGFQISLRKMLSQSESYAKETGNPDIYNANEAKALLEMERRIVNGETKSDLNPTWHPSGIKYFANMMLEGEAEAGAKVKVSYLNVGAIYGRNLSVTEAKLVMEQIRERHVDDKTKINDETGHAFLSLEKTTIRNQEIGDAIKTLALRNYLREEMSKTNPQSISRVGNFSNYERSVISETRFSDHNLKPNRVIPGERTGKFKTGTEVHQPFETSWTINAIGTLLAAEFISRRKKLQEDKKQNLSVLEQIKAINLIKYPQKPDQTKTGKPIGLKLPQSHQTESNKTGVKNQVEKQSGTIITKDHLVRVNGDTQKPVLIFEKIKVVNPDKKQLKKINTTRFGLKERVGLTYFKKENKRHKEMRRKIRKEKIRQVGGLKTETKKTSAILFKQLIKQTQEYIKIPKVLEKLTDKITQKHRLIRKIKETIKFTKSENKRNFLNKIRLISRLKFIGELIRVYSEVRLEPKNEKRKADKKMEIRQKKKDSLNRETGKEVNEKKSIQTRENFLMLFFVLALWRINNLSIHEKTTKKLIRKIKQVLTNVNRDQIQNKVGLKPTTCQSISLISDIADCEKEIPENNPSSILLAIILFMTKIREQRAPSGNQKKKKVKRKRKLYRQLMKPFGEFHKQGTIFAYGS